MATVTYSLVNKVPAFLVNTSLKTGTQTDPVAFALSAGTYVSLWSTPNPTSFDIDANTLNPSGTSASSGEFRANATDNVTGDQFDPAITQITTGPNAGTILATYTDSVPSAVSDIRLVHFNSNGTAPTTSTLVWQNANFGKVDSAITALSNGGFAVTFTRVDYGPGGPTGSNNVIYQAYDNTLSPLGLNFVDSSSAVSVNSSVAGLTGGGFVVAWELTPAGGGAKSVWFQRYDNAGVAAGVDGSHLDGTHVQIGAATGTANADIQVRALPDGGFAVAYVVNNGATANDIVAQVFNANGTPRTGSLNVNLTTSGDQDKPSLAVLSNGIFAVSWTDETTHQSGYRVFDTNGNGGAETFLNSNVVKNSITALTSFGLVASEFESTTSEPGGSGDAIRSTVNELVRSTTGTIGAETLTGDSLRDVINAFAGADTLTGGANADTFVFIAGGVGGGQVISSGSVITDYDRGNTPGVYNAAEGDVIDVSALLSAAYNHGNGLPLSAIVRAANLGGTVSLQVNVNGAFNNWQTVATLQNIVVGNSVSVVVDQSLAPVTLTVDSPPVIGSSLATITIPEHVSAVTTVHATDAEGSAVTYSISGGQDAGVFQINSSTGVLSFVTAPDFAHPTDSDHNNSYFVIVRASDGNLFDQESVAVTVTKLSIDGARGGQSTTDEQAISPFTGVSVFDSSTGLNHTLTVALSNPANGSLTNFSGGSYNASNGIYTVTGSIAAVTAALDGLIFNPIHQTGPTQTITTSFTITDTDSSGSITTNSATSVVATHTNLNPAFRFFDSATGDHFYTLSPTEASQIRATLPTYHDEGTPWSTPDTGPGSIDVFRFFDVATGTHFLTSSVAERDQVMATLPSYHYEGVAFEAYQATGAGTLTLERFFNTQSNLHTYSASAAETASILNGGAGPGWVDEGAGFIVHT